MQIGLALALDLGKRGLRSTIIERSLDTSTEFLAKADFLNERSMEFCRWLGLRDEVANVGFPEDVTRDTVFCTSLNGHFIGRLPMPSLKKRQLPPQCREMHRRCPQFWFDPMIARAVIRQGTCNIRYGYEFVRCEQDDHGVTCEVIRHSDKQVETIRAKYLVACDGLASSVCKAVDIERSGEELGYSASVVVETHNLWDYHPFGQCERYMFVSPQGVWSNLTAIDGNSLYRLTLVGLEEKLDLAKIDMHAIVRKALGRDDIAFELKKVLLWRRSRVTAETFSKGRVLLAGDSAHTMSPTGGHGLNTGLGDVMDLGWILQALVEGWGGSGLLEAYTAERRPVAIRNGMSSSQNYAIWVERKGRERVLEQGAEADEQRRILGERMADSLEQEFRSLGIAMGYNYADSPIIVPDGTQAPVDEPSVYVQTARPGHRAPHCWLDDGRSIIDLFGARFVLLDFGAKTLQHDKVSSIAKEIGLPLKLVRVWNKEAAKLYGRKLVLVRPDGMVAWRGDNLPLDVRGLLDQVRGAK